MNLNIKNLVEEYVQGFNPAVLDNGLPRKKFSQKDINDAIYYHPKNKEDLKKHIQILLNNGETDLNCIDTSEITDFSNLFSGVENNSLTTELAISLDISKWDVSKGKDFSFMFYFCNGFNCDITDWDVSSGENFEYMFANNEFFNQDLSLWNITNGTNFNHMFFNCKSFDQDLSGWSSKFYSKANIRYMFKNTPINTTRKQPKKQ